MTLHELLPPETLILVTDDVRSARLAVCAALQALGYQNIIEAENGQQAWEKLVKTPQVRLIISDWQMPVVEGIELADRVVNDIRFENIPVILATQKGEWQDLAQATVAGVWGYIVKPVSVQGLAQELENVMREWHQRGDAPAEA